MGNSAPIALRRYVEYAHPNYGAHAMSVVLTHVTVYFSYTTPVAFLIHGTGKTFVRENEWGSTTRRHMGQASRLGQDATHLPRKEFELGIAMAIGEEPLRAANTETILEIRRHNEILKEAASAVKTASAAKKLRIKTAHVRKAMRILDALMPGFSEVAEEVYDMKIVRKSRYDGWSSPNRFERIIL